MKLKSLNDLEFKIKFLKMKLRISEKLNSIKYDSYFMKNPPKGQKFSKEDPYGEEDWTEDDKL